MRRRVRRPASPRGMQPSGWRSRSRSGVPQPAGVSRFFSAADAETLEQMLKDSASHQQEVTDRLGYQVREAVEEIIRSLDRIDQDEKRQLLRACPSPNSTGPPSRS